MKRLNIKIGEKEYSVEVAETQEEKETGLQGRTELGPSEGMLFDFSDEVGDVSMWMKNTKIPLDIIFINDEEQVVFVGEGIPNTETQITVQNVAYVLEVNQGSGIKEGDELNFEEENNDAPVMRVLAQDGSTQMDLWGGERIFRRPFTKQIIKWAKRAEKVKGDEEKFNKICIRLGKKMFKEIKAQDNRPPEYVNASN